MLCSMTRLAGNECDVESRESSGRRVSRPQAVTAVALVAKSGGPCSFSYDGCDGSAAQSLLSWVAGSAAKQGPGRQAARGKPISQAPNWTERVFASRKMNATTPSRLVCLRAFKPQVNVTAAVR